LTEYRLRCRFLSIAVICISSSLAVGLSIGRPAAGIDQSRPAAVELRAWSVGRWFGRLVCALHLWPQCHDRRFVSLSTVYDLASAGFDLSIPERTYVVACPVRLSGLVKQPTSRRDVMVEARQNRLPRRRHFSLSLLPLLLLLTM
jgi:hypothetical protein